MSLQDSPPSKIPRIAITPGEPAGIGPDLIVILAEKNIPAELVIVGSTRVLQERAAALGKTIDLIPFHYLFVF